MDDVIMINIFGSNMLSFGDNNKFKKKKERVENTLIMLKSFVSKIDNYIHRLEEREKQLFEKVVDLTTMGDDARAMIVAGEIQQIRSVLRHLTALRYIMEGIVLKIENYIAIGEAMGSIGPALSALREIRGVFKGLIPSIEMETQLIENSLRDLISSTGEYIPPTTWYSPQSTNEAKKILEEAYAVAEKRLRETFPQVKRSSEKNSMEIR
ncbi:MAG: hypothetical protein DJ555_05565 [Desulfurococcaceae archaeon]|nr:MAG: hypothetical protein DJ555_05565 [Desulfurococcaceae archaeon]